MGEEFNLEIINPDKSFLNKKDVTEVVVPALEGEMGILKDHISIISFLKPGIIKVYSKSGEDQYYIEDGILEFKNNNLSVLTSSIINVKDLEKSKIQELMKLAEEDVGKPDLNDQSRYLVDQKIEVLKSTTTSVIISKSIHFHSKNSGFFVLIFILSSVPKYLIINHFCF